MIHGVMLGLLLLGVPPDTEVLGVLDAMNRAASEADGETYFAQFAADGVFIGTAAEERWTIGQFREFAEPYFAEGRGWTYVPRPDSRHVDFSPDGNVAWFDELLDNEKYGTCRGTGVLRRESDGTWKIVQYSLSIPIPNEIALDVVGMIGGSTPPATGAQHEPEPDSTDQQ